MKSDKEKAIKKVSLEEAHIKERVSFKSLLLSNPNYFGNLADSKLKAVLPIAGNTNFESLGCVGYQPQQKQLEAVVYLYQPSGYGTDICGQGTPEYVRFYLSYDGVSWIDQGLTSFQAHNIPEGTEGSKRLEYAVSLPINPIRKFCIANPLIQVRAILSWNNPPPANQPGWTPIWGNVRDATILVEPRRFIFPPEIFEIAKAKVPPFLSDFIDLDTPIETKSKVLGAAELAIQYKDADVPPSRFAFKELTAFASGKTNLSAEAFAKILPDVKLDPSIFEILFPPTDGNISYEELKCIGLDPNHPDTLVGVIQVKKSAGYSGGPCTDGSREYVTFWGDFDGNGSFETCLGTASVRVYDLANIPDQGVHYAVRLPVDLNQYRQACKKGPKVVRIRAILSWNSPAPCANPNHVPAWGNREETLINIAPSAGAPAGKIAILGGIPVSMIYDAGAVVGGELVEGLTTPSAVFATNNLPPDNPDGNILTADGRPCPFAGRVSVQGAPLLGSSYKVEVIPVGGGAPSDVVTNLTLVRSNGTTYTVSANVATGRFDYQDFNDNINGLLAQWDTTGDASWVVRLTTYNGSAGSVFAVPTGTDSHVIQLDNTWPEVDLEITSGAGSCGKFSPGSVLAGTFVARDKYFSSYSLGVEPAVNDPGEGIPSPSSGLVQTAVAPGDAWTLDTTGMKPCGYIIRVVATDRAIVNSQAVGHHSSDSAGFCLDAKGNN